MVHQPSPPSPEKSRGCCVYRKAILEKIFLETWPTRVLLIFIWLLQLHFSCLRIYDLQLIFLTTEILSCTLCSISCLPFFSSEKLAKHTSHFVQTCFCSLLTEKDACQYFKIFFQYITTGPFPQDTICHINLSLKLCISHSPTNFAIYIHYYIVFWLIYFQGALGAYLNSDQANLPQMSRIMHSLQLVMSNLQTLPVPPSSLFPLSFSTL